LWDASQSYDEIPLHTFLDDSGQKDRQAKCWRFMPVILPTWDAEIRKIEV
jgi:hypothetical protein